MIKEMTINAITKYIEDNIEISNIDIDSLVSYTGYGRRYLQKIFKDTIGLPVGKYIQLRRVSRAAVFLRYTHLSLVSISTRLCYDSQQTFSREFKKNTGYTPLQYRKNKVWTFRHMIGHRNSNDLFPLPKIIHMKKKTIYGYLFEHKEKVPYTGEKSGIRWEEINKKLNDQDTIRVSNKAMADDESHDEIFISTVIWTNKKQSNIQIDINSGMYACFSFIGSHECYSHFIKHIYMNVIPFYDLKKRDVFDMEIISKGDNNLLCFRYFLPIESES
ncbi:TPA: helix-turn-helix domain-containing protein [Citrobacter freundii]